MPCATSNVCQYKRRTLVQVSLDWRDCPTTAQAASQEDILEELFFTGAVHKETYICAHIVKEGERRAESDETAAHLWPATLHPIVLEPSSVLQ